MKAAALVLALACLTLFAQPLLLNDVVWGSRRATGSGASSSFTTTNDIVIEEDGAATPYPANVVVTGLVATITKVTVTITNLWHNFPTDMQFVLVSPNSLAVKFLGGAGGTSPVTVDWITLDDDAAGYVPDGFTASTYKPTDGEPGYTFPADAGLPAGPYATNLSTFAGMSSGDANGLWLIYVADATALDGGALTNVTLTITQ